MEKKETFNYNSPAVKVINFTIQNSILTGSLTGDADEPVPGPQD